MNKRADSSIDRALRTSNRIAEAVVEHVHDCDMCQKDIVTDADWLGVGVCGYAEPLVWEWRGAEAEYLNALLDLTAQEERAA